jgi:maltose phosphorylase
VDPWRIIEDGFNPEENRLAESIFSLGNEHMGLRGFFEEGYSGDSLQGTYVAGIYYPDKTRVGWWKNGYPEFFAKVINSTNWVGVGIEADGTRLDLGHCKVRDFRRELDMKEGKLTRSFIWIGEDGRETRMEFTRFLSMVQRSLAAISVTITPLNYDGRFGLTSSLDGRVVNEDANYGEVFWDEVEHEVKPDYAILTMKTKKTGFLLTIAGAK